MKYTTKRFVQQNLLEIIQVIKSKNIEGSELFISHSFITEHPKDEELNQEQIRRIVKPIQKMLLADLRSQQQLEDELKKVLSLLGRERIFPRGRISEYLTSDFIWRTKLIPILDFGFWILDFETKNLCFLFIHFFFSENAN